MGVASGPRCELQLLLFACRLVVGRVVGWVGQGQLLLQPEVQSMDEARLHGLMVFLSGTPSNV
eukprot:6043806-Alexandrium_andersonii.AAC.1